MDSVTSNQSNNNFEAGRSSPSLKFPLLMLFCLAVIIFVLILVNGVSVYNKDMFIGLISNTTTFLI